MPKYFKVVHQSPYKKMTAEAVEIKDKLDKLKLNKNILIFDKLIKPLLK